MTFTEFETAINCSIGCDNSQQGKFKMLIWARDYQAALESGIDLSPKEFDASRNNLNPVG